MPSNYTEKQYEYTRTILRDLYGKNYLQYIIDNTKEVAKELSDLYPNDSTRSEYFRRIKHFCIEKKLPEHQINSVYDDLKKYQEKEKQPAKNKLKPALDAEVPWDVILDIRKMLKKNKNNSWKDFQNYLIMSLFTYLPPVNVDYGLMIVTKKYHKQKENCCVWTLNRPKFVFPSIKVPKQRDDDDTLLFDKKSIVIRGKLHEIITEWFSKFNKKQKHLLLDLVDQSMPMSRDEIARVLKKLISQNIQGGIKLTGFQKSYLIHIDNKLNLRGKRGAEIKNINGYSFPPTREPKKLKSKLNSKKDDEPIADYLTL